MSYSTRGASTNGATMNGASINGATSVTQPWRRETVQAFFEGFAWGGERQGAGRAQTLEAEQNPVSYMTLAVGDFFPSVPWEGNPAIGVPIAPLAAQAPATVVDTDLTLDGFSDLFG